MINGRTVVTLCGSTKNEEVFRTANRDETLAQKVVYSIGVNMRRETELFEGMSEQELNVIKADLDAIHFCKIDMSDEILVLNVDGYVGESTRREIAYARATGKVVRWLEPDKAI